jgi:molecular chaperone GrpE
MAFGWKKRMEAKNETDPADLPAGLDDAVPVDAELLESPASDDAAEAIAQLTAERDEALEHAQRALADYQNLRRRTQSDIDAASKRARAEVLSEALTVLDYLDMALATECSTEEGKNLKVGVAMTRGQLAALLERFKVKEMPASTIFDAQYHQAFATIETAEHPPGAIVEVFRKGWLYGDQVLRHAQVRVAAAPKVAEPPAPADGGVQGVRDESHDRLSD